MPSTSTRAMRLDLLLAAEAARGGVVLGIKSYGVSFPFHWTMLLALSSPFVQRKLTCVQTVLNTAIPDTILEVAEADLSRDEDNITSLAVGRTKGGATLVYAGVNSSAKDIEAGRNQHFRIFNIETTAAGKSKKGAKEKEKARRTSVSESLRSSLFVSKDKDAYQRVLRVSRPDKGGASLGAAASGLAKNPELVIFDTAAQGNKGPNVNIRGHVKLEKEVGDVDVIQTGEGSYTVVYCDSHRIYALTVKDKVVTSEPVVVNAIPGFAEEAKQPIGTFRSLRFLTPNFVAVLINLSNRSGVVVQILRLIGGDKAQGRLAQTLNIPSRVKQATALAIANLSPPETPGGPQGASQFIIAVAGQDTSITLGVLDYEVYGNNILITQPKLLTTLKDVHPLQITGIAFSYARPSTFSSSEIQASTTPAHPVLRLASISVANTVITHTIPLSAPKRKSAHTTVALKAITPFSFNPRKVITIAALIFTAFLVQTILELSGNAPNLLDMSNRIPAHWQPFIVGEAPGTGKHQYIPKVPKIKVDTEGARKIVSDAGDAFTDALKKLKKHNSEGHPVVLYPTPPPLDSSSASGSDHSDSKGSDGSGNPEHPHIAIHNPSQGAHDGKPWEELSHSQKEEWKRRLKEVGHWTEEMPGTLLKGVMFAEIAEAVGEAVRG
jgi:hypothetical protein